MADKKVDLQEIVDCYQATEQALFAANTANAQTMQCIDASAREANLAGYNIRSFDLAYVQEMHAEASVHIGEAIRLILIAHQSASAVAENLEIPIPMPRTGGR